MAGILYGVQGIPPVEYQHPAVTEGAYVVYEECLKMAEMLAANWKS
jgi:hypothetical protein